MINNDEGDDNQEEDIDGCDDDNDLSPLLGSFPPVYRVTGHVGETAQAAKDHDDDDEDILYIDGAPCCSLKTRAPTWA